MLRSDKPVRYFTTDVPVGDADKRLRIFDIIKNNAPVNVADISEKAGVSGEFLTNAIAVYQENNIIKLKEEDKTVDWKTSERSFLGVGFDGENCFLVLMDIEGKVTRKEKIFLPTLKGLKGRIREFKEITKELARGTRLRSTSLYMAGMAVSENLEERSEKVVPMLAEGVSHLFGCRVIVAKGATAAAYAEREKNEEAKGKDVLYLHTDSGNGVLRKKETILEKKDQGEGPGAYLRPWGQFNAVSTARHLVNKGLGTDLVTLVGGDIDGITMADVLDAAHKGDELAEDLVKRSALALGVRTAYLVNILDVENIILGGGIDKKEGNFADYMHESMERFLVKEKIGKIKITYGELGEEAYSTGAALLCRRELFTEV
jgi:predicted NBD/HSP70 family sugar kinase